MALLTCTGAALNLFVVKTAAAEHGASETIIAKSGNFVFEGLTPTWVPETENPLGYVPDLGTYFCFASGIDDPSGAEYALVWPRSSTLSLNALRVVVHEDDIFSA